MPALLLASSCAPSATLDREATGERFADLREALAAYDSAGFLAGPPEFPVVGRPVVLPGPPDSVFLGFTASMPPSALRFARDGDLVAARYQVTMLVRSAADTVRRIDRHETVRVVDFSAAASRRPRVVFQLFVTAPAGPLGLDVRVRDLASRAEAERRFELEADRGLASPLAARRAEPRSTLATQPAILSYARHTPVVTEPDAHVLVEDGTGGPGRAVLSVIHGDARVWEDTVSLAEPAGGPAAAVTALPVHLIPPGRASLRVERPDRGIWAAAPLYIGLSPEWVLPSWEASVARLAYALDPGTLEAWQQAPPADRAGLWRRFQGRTDPDTTTAANEHLARYFERMSTANDRFDEPGRAGWETDRGEVLVKLGAADAERFIRPEREGEVPRIEWEYDESIPTSVVIEFEDTTDFGVFRMTPRSRVALRRVVREVEAAEAEARTEGKAGIAGGAGSR